MEIGDRARTSLDESSENYSNFIFRHYNFQPAPKEVWVRVHYRGVAQHSQQSTGVHLVSGVEHQRRKLERAREAASVLSALTEGCLRKFPSRNKPSVTFANLGNRKL